MTKKFTFASDNTAGLCPEAWEAFVAANAGGVPGYGNDAFTAEAKKGIAELFETECEVHLVSSGSAANGLALAALAKPHHGILCHDAAHIAIHEGGGPEFFTGGAKILPLPGRHGKIDPVDLARRIEQGRSQRFPPVCTLSLTQATEFGVVYTPGELQALTAIARAEGFPVHLDGARFANAAAALHDQGVSPADLTWRAGVDVLCFGGAKNGLLATEAVVFFNRGYAREFAYRVKQSGHLASKMRFAGAQWTAVLRDGAWRRHAAHANRQARKLGAGLVELGFTLAAPVEANGVFVEMAPPVAAALQARGWSFYRFLGEHGHRLMCSWATTDEQVESFLADARVVIAG